MLNDSLSPSVLSFEGPKSPPPTVGARLSLFWRVWERKGAHPWVVSVLREGYSLEFNTKPKLSSTPNVQSAASSNPSRDLVLQGLIHDLLSKGAVEQVDNPLSPGFYSRLFFVPKKTGGARPIIDLSTLNENLVVPKFKMETVASIRQGLEPGRWVFSIDLKDAYFQVPIHPASRKYLRFQFRDKVYQFRALPFGVSSAPWLFTKVMIQVKLLAQKVGVQMFQYLDDWLGQSLSFQASKADILTLVNLCRELGLVINWEKSELIPSQTFDFVGAHFNLIQGLISPTQKHLKEVMEVAREFLNSPGHSANSWQHLIGVLGAQEKFIPFGRLHLRPLQWHLQDHWAAHRDPPHAWVPVTQSLRQHLVWWTELAHLSPGVPLVPPPHNVRVFTDASTQGWGAHVEGVEFQGLWSRTERLLHINVLEMRAITLALKRLKLQTGDSVLVATDNSSVVAYINKQGGTRSRSLWMESQSLFLLVLQLGIRLRARHIPGRLNVIADRLSRQGQVLPTEWSLHPEVVKSIFLQWGTPHVDLFATRLNNKCQMFVSPVPDPLAMETDALSMSWEGMIAYAYPPHQIMPQVLIQFKRTKACRLILIAPWWPNQMWFPELLRIKQGQPLALPVRSDLLVQPQSNLFHYDPGFLRLHAWLLVRQP